jgi:hypothetical protein
MVRLRFRALLTLALSVAVAGCSESDTTPTPTTPTTYTVVFTGTLGQHDAETFTFLTLSSGSVVATLTSLAPDSTLRVGLSMGTWNGTTCQTILANDRATQSTQIVGQVNASGSLCVRIYDVGSVVESTTFEVQVVHP